MHASAEPAGHNDRPPLRGNKLLVACSAVLVGALIVLPTLPDPPARPAVASAAGTVPPTAPAPGPAAAADNGSSATTPSTATTHTHQAARSGTPAHTHPPATTAAGSSHRHQHALSLAAPASTHAHSHGTTGGGHAKPHATHGSNGSAHGSGGSHDHGGGTCSNAIKGAHDKLCDAPPLKRATEAQKAAARRMLAQAKAAARKYRDVDVARKAGFIVAEFPKRNFAHVHLRKEVQQELRRKLGQRAFTNIGDPKTLIYMRLKSGDAVPVGIMLVDGNDPAPTAAGPIFRWHIHPDGRPPSRFHYMGHIWFTNRLESAYAMHLPSKELESIFGERRR